MRFASTFFNSVVNNSKSVIPRTPLFAISSPKNYHEIPSPSFFAIRFSSLKRFIACLTNTNSSQARVGAESGLTHSLEKTPIQHDGCGDGARCILTRIFHGQHFLLVSDSRAVPHLRPRRPFSGTPPAIYRMRERATGQRGHKLRRIGGTRIRCLLQTMKCTVTVASDRQSTAQHRRARATLAVLVLDPKVQFLK